MVSKAEYKRRMRQPLRSFEEMRMEAVREDIRKKYPIPPSPLDALKGMESFMKGGR